MTEQTTCANCHEQIDPEGADDSRWASVLDAMVCWGCYESDTSHASVLHFVEDGTTSKVYVGDLDIFNEWGDPITHLNITRDWVSSGYRGHYETRIEEWVDVLDGWTTGGWDDPIARRKADFNEWAESLMSGDLVAPFPIAIVADPTSNVFSMGITVLVREKDVEGFRAWLSDDYDNLYASLT